MKKEQFLAEKLSNFCRFLTEVVNKLPEDRVAEARGFVSSLETISMERFVSVIATLAMYRGNSTAGIERLLLEARIDRGAFTHDEFEKARRYLEMFIDVICE